MSRTVIVSRMSQKDFYEACVKIALHGKAAAEQSAAAPTRPIACGNMRKTRTRGLNVC